MYAANYLVDVPSQGWNAEEKQIKSNPDRVYSLDEFKKFLQKHRLLVYIQTANVVIKIISVYQQSAQSVLQLIAYLKKLENQINSFYCDRTRRDHLFVAIHEYLRRTIIKYNRLLGTQAELEQVATSIKAAVISLKDIKVKQRYIFLSTNTGQVSKSLSRGQH